MTAFPKRLRALRKDKKITQTELGEAIGVQQATIAKWESGERTPFIEYFIELAKYFNVSIDYLVGLEDFE